MILRSPLPRIHYYQSQAVTKPFKRRDHRCLFIGCNPIHTRKSQLKWRIPTPLICPKLNSTPTSNRIFLLNSSQPIRILLNKPHTYTPLYPPILPQTLELQPFSKALSPQSQTAITTFPSKALLKVVNFLTPNPPFSKGAHTLSHPTKCVLESPLQEIPLQLLNFIGHMRRNGKKGYKISGKTR